MPKFLKGNELNFELGKLFEKAEVELILISPYIKLHDRYISVLKSKKANHNLRITIVFGKNEEDMSRSMKQTDFDFFKEFPNIEIRYEKNLHAKYYSNEEYGILTSMNLYNYSQDNNIEAGVMTKSNFLNSIANNLISIASDKSSLDIEAFEYFNLVIDQSVLLFCKTPNYESTMLGLSNRYINSNVEVDLLTNFFANKVHYEQYNKNHSSNHKPNNLLPQQELKEDNSISRSKFLSTTALSKEIGISNKDLSYKLEKLCWIERVNNDWILTSLGVSKGAQIKKGQYGDYIAWPDTIINNIH